LALVGWWWWPTTALSPSEIAYVPLASPRSEDSRPAPLPTARYDHHPQYEFHYRWGGTMRDTLWLYGVSQPIRELRFRDEGAQASPRYLIRIGNQDYALSATLDPQPLVPNLPPSP
jgi:hypothetical protein